MLFFLNLIFIISSCFGNSDIFSSPRLVFDDITVGQSMVFTDFGSGFEQDLLIVAAGSMGQGQLWLLPGGHHEDGDSFNAKVLIAENLFNVVEYRNYVRLLVVDVDNDGLQDVVIGSNYECSLLRQRPRTGLFPQFDPRITLYNVTSPTSVDQTFLVRLPEPAVCLVQNDLGIVLLTGPLFATATTVVPLDGAYRALLSDVTGDQIQDFVVATSGSLGVHVHQFDGLADGTWPAGQLVWSAPGTPFFAHMLLNLNEGQLDVALSYTSPSSVVFFRDSWQPPAPDAVWQPTYPAGFGMVGDFDDDGITDFVHSVDFSPEIVYCRRLSENGLFDVKPLNGSFGAVVSMAKLRNQNTGRLDLFALTTGLESSMRTTVIAFRNLLSPITLPPSPTPTPLPPGALPTTPQPTRPPTPGVQQQPSPQPAAPVSPTGTPDAGTPQQQQRPGPAPVPMDSVILASAAVLLLLSVGFLWVCWTVRRGRRDRRKRAGVGSGSGHLTSLHASAGGGGVRRSRRGTSASRRSRSNSTGPSDSGARISPRSSRARTAFTQGVVYANITPTMTTAMSGAESHYMEIEPDSVPIIGVYSGRDQQSAQGYTDNQYSELHLSPKPTAEVDGGGLGASTLPTMTSNTLTVGKSGGKSGGSSGGGHDNNNHGGPSPRSEYAEAFENPSFSSKEMALVKPLLKTSAANDGNKRVSVPGYQTVPPAQPTPQASDASTFIIPMTSEYADVAAIKDEANDIDSESEHK